MKKAKCFCMQRLSWAESKAVINKLFVFAVYCSFYDLITAIKIIIKQRVPDVFHVYPYLLCTSRLQHTFYQRYIIKPLYHCVMSNSFFSVVSFGIGFK